MKLLRQFERELSSIGSGGATTITVDDRPRTLTCDITERNSLAVSFDQLRLATAELASADGGPARAHRQGARRTAHVSHGANLPDRN